ncbi:hypothetical protein Agub_g7944, partial [Astrephomene gubernaculifera]
MSLATRRSMGSVSCSGRHVIQHNTYAASRCKGTIWPAAATTCRSRMTTAIRGTPSDELPSAPSLSEDSPAPPNVIQIEEPNRNINTSNYRALAALASVGLAETAYLTYAKLFDAPLVCPTNGCDSVLNSPYAQLFGLPLSLFGMLAYGTVGILAVSYMMQQQQPTTPASATPSATSATARRLTSWGLTAGVAALATTSAVLVSLLHSRFPGSSCAWCLLSAATSTALAVTLATSMSGREWRDNALAGLGGALTAAALLFLGGPGGPLAAAGSGGSVLIDDNFFLEYQAPTITSPSSPRALALSRRLAAAGARMYGAFWCSHCAEQKEEFGVQAVEGQGDGGFPYVECFPNGWRRGEPLAPACEAAGVRNFPT